MPRDDRLLVRFPAEHLEREVQDRLWDELIDHAIHLGADRFSVQSDLPYETLPPEAGQARASLLAYMALHRPRRSVLGLRPPTWPLEPAAAEWIREAGPWAYRSTLWKGNEWVLESELWGKHFTLIARPEEWSQLQRDKSWLASLKPPPTSEEFRKADERVRRGWAISRPVRLLAALATAIAVAAASSPEGGSGWLFGGAFMGILTYLLLPSREPGPAHRLIAQARLPSDPRFDRRFRRFLNLSSIAAVVAAFAAPLAYLSGPGSAGRLAFGSLAVVGLILALYGVGVATWWMFKYRRNERP